MTCDARRAADLRELYPAARIDAVRFGAPDPLAAAATPPAAAEPPAAAARPPAAPALVFGVCAPTAMVRRLEPIVDAFAALPPAPPTRLQVLGPVARRADVQARIDALRLGGRVTLERTPIPDAALRSTDVCICLAWPPAGETTPLWIRCLAAGKPTIVGPRPCPDQAPLLDPRTWRHRHGAPEDGIAVAVDVVDEADTLALAMRASPPSPHAAPPSGPGRGATGNATTAKRRWPTTTGASSRPPPRRRRRDRGACPRTWEATAWSRPAPSRPKSA